MKNKGILGIVALLLIVAVAGTAFVARRLYYRHKAQKEQRWEFKAEMALTRELPPDQMEGLLKSFNEILDDDEVLLNVVEDLDLVSRWEVTSEGEAIELARQASNFSDSGKPGSILFIVSDRDKELAGMLADRIGASFDRELNRRRFQSPPGEP